MVKIPPNIVDEIFSTARIEEVIGEFVQLKKSGANYKGLSPFTEEKTPSFVVSPAKQIFKCFSSGKGGTVATFLMEYEQFSYPEALKWLAERYNIQLPEEKPLTEEEKEAISERESLQIINTFARDFFSDTLHTTAEGKAIGLSYFKERGFSAEIIKKFQLGYSPIKEKSFTDTAIEKGYKQEYLEALGLTKTHEDRKFDFFRGRVMFPIHSVSGKVLGFGGRVLKTDKQIAKYFNSPESQLYDKSKILYGIYFAKNEIIKQDNCYLVEGYTDVISLSQAGVDNVVSSSGTSLTKGQIKLLQRFTNNITVLYDSDKAGIKASFRGIDLLLEEGINVEVLSFPEGEDPDSYAKSVDADELKAYLAKHKQDFIGFKSEILLKDAANDPLQRSKLIKDIIHSISLIPDEITRSVYLKETARRFEVEEKALLNELNRDRRQYLQEAQRILEREEKDFFAVPQNKDQLSAQNQTGKRKYYAQEKDLLRILLLYGSRAIEIKDKEGETIEISAAELIVHEIERDKLYFQDPLLEKIYLQCKKGMEAGTFYEPAYFLRNDDKEIVSFVTDILTPRFELSTHWLKKYNIEVVGELHQLPLAVKEALYTFKNTFILRKIAKIRKQLETAKESDEVNDLLRKQIKWENIRAAFAIQLGRIVG